MSNYLPTDYQSFIATSRYARWIDAENRRENWGETVGRYIENVVVPKVRDELVLEEVEVAILCLDVMPSMRALMTAGPALVRDNTAAYNCAYMAVDDPKAFDEAMYILMNGTGVGFSVEQRYINQLPIISESFFQTNTKQAIRLFDVVKEF